MTVLVTSRVVLWYHNYFLASETVELSDESGTVKNLRNNLNDYGIDYLKERETLILLKVDCK